MAMAIASAWKRLNDRWQTRNHWRPLRTLRAQLILAYLLVVVLALGSLVIWSAGRLRQEIIESKEHDLEIQAHLLAIVFSDLIQETLVGNIAPGELRSYMTPYLSEEDRRVTIVDHEMFVLFSTDEQVQSGFEDNHIEFMAARQGREKHDIRLDEFTGHVRIFTAAPVFDADQQLVAYIQVSAPMAPVNTRIWQAWVGLISILAGVALVVAWIGVRMSGHVARPLSDLTRAALVMAGGHLGQRIEPNGPDEVKQLAQAFNHMSEHLQNLVNRQRQFAANAAHELRSPLAALRLRLEMLQEHRLKPEEQAAFISEVICGVDHLQRIIDQLLTLASLEESNRLPPGRVDLAPLIYDLMDDMTPLIQAAGLTVQVEAPAHLPPVRVNAEQMRMILWNLVDNACKYTPAGGLVRVFADAEPRYVRVQMQDTGPGIPPDVLPHLFERFRRGMRDRQRQPGAGLGLALVAELAALNQVDLAVDSRPDQGSTFTLLCPRI